MPRSGPLWTDEQWEKHDRLLPRPAKNLRGSTLQDFRFQISGNKSIKHSASFHQFIWRPGPPGGDTSVGTAADFHRE